MKFLIFQGSGACPECDVPLRRSNFKLQLFEDATIDKEVEIRRRIIRIFCKSQEDFSSLRDYNDYLELVEDIIFNLANNIDVDITNRKIQDYKSANTDFIRKNQNKISAERLELEDIISEEKRIDAKRKQEDVMIEVKTKSAKMKNKEKLIDDLMFSDTDAKTILQEHQTKAAAQFTSAADFINAKKDYKKTANTIIIEAKPYVYEIPEMNFDGPLPPLDEDEVEQKRFNQHIRPAETFEKAAGYIESMGALRALQEAMSGLYFNDF